MSSVAARRFAALLEGSVSDDGLTRPTDLRRLASAKEKIADPRERAAAEDLLTFVRHDRELDANEVAPSRRALRALLGVPEGHLPPGVDRVLRRAAPPANVLVQHYALELDLRGPGPEHDARAVVTLERPARRNVILEIDPARIQIDAVRARGRDVPFRVEGRRLHITAPGARALDIRYRVRATEDENGFGLIRDAKRGGFNTLTWPYMTGALFPSSPATKDGVTATIDAKTERGVTVVGAGADGRGRINIDAPVPPYAIALYAGTFTRLPPIRAKCGVTVTVHGQGNSVREKTRREYQRAVADAVDYFSALLGPYRYGDHLRLVEVGGDYGGMEHAGAVALMVSSMRAADSAVETAVHETAHHWFGDNLRIQDPGEFWMSEGFTNFITYRFLGVRDGERRLHDAYDAAKDAVRAALRHRKPALAGPDHVDARAIFTDIPYQLGAWVLRMMETELGADRFDALLSHWYQRNNFAAVTTDQFLAFVKAETGRDFGPFFRAWSTIDAVPTFRDRSRIDGTAVHVELAARTTFPEGLRIPVVLEGDGQRAVFQVDPTKPETLDAGFVVRRIRWDPERRVLADVDR